MTAKGDRFMSDTSPLDPPTPGFVSRLIKNTLFVLMCMFCFIGFPVWLVALFNPVTLTNPVEGFPNLSHDRGVVSALSDRELAARPWFQKAAALGWLLAVVGIGFGLLRERLFPSPERNWYRKRSWLLLGLVILPVLLAVAYQIGNIQGEAGVLRIEPGSLEDRVLRENIQPNELEALLHRSEPEPDPPRIVPERDDARDP